MAKAKNKPRLAVAGPGAGKTYSMVDEIVAGLANLSPHRHLAAITYTNAAANTIRERLHRRVSPRRNVFVGTTHAFVNRFVLKPFASIFGILPEDPLFAAIDVQAKGRGAPIYTKNLIKKGIVPYDAMLPKARELLNKRDIRERVAGRLQYLFIDEFQDTNIVALDIFEKIRKPDHTAVYAVGDPEQYIMGFTYRGVKPPEFSKIPFYRLQEKAERIPPLPYNHRSNAEIVDFTRQFRNDLQQEAVKPRREQARVLFVELVNLAEIVQVFQARSAGVEREGQYLERLYLAYENKQFDSVSEQFAITPIANSSRKARTLLGDALELIAMTIGRTPRKAREELRLTEIEWRKIGVTALRKLGDMDFSVDDFVKLVSDRLGYRVSDSRKESVAKELSALKGVIASGRVASQRECSSSIHKAKGLEADAVLVVAKTTKELDRWLTTDGDTRNNDKNDTCRLGYVAFTRAREMLCIACLKPIDAAMKQRLRDLGVTIVS